MSRVHGIVVLVLALLSMPAAAADYPSPKQGDWIARDFRFHSGEVTPELRLHYTTVGEPSGQPGGPLARLGTAHTVGQDQQAHAGLERAVPDRTSRRGFE